MAEDQRELAAKMLADLGVGTTEKMGKAQTLKLGTHKLVVLDGGFLVNQKTKQSRNPERRLVIDFVVLESRGPNPDDPAPYEPGAKVQIAFFVERAEHPQYEVSRFQDMTESMMIGLRADGTQSDFGGLLLTPDGRGVQAQVEITLGNPHKKKQGAFYHDESWTPVPQTEEDVAALAQELEEHHGPWKAPGEVAAPKKASPTVPAGRSFLKK